MHRLRLRRCGERRCFNRLLLSGVAIAGVAGFLIALTGCGFIADKDRIKIAKLKGQDGAERYVTRGDLFKVIREMPDDERPTIRNKGDLLRVLNSYIDQQIKLPLADGVEAELKAQGKALASRETAMQRYFKLHDDDNYAQIYRLQNADQLGMSEAQLIALKQEIDLGIDRVYDLMRCDNAVAYRSIADFKGGALKLVDADFEKEFAVRKDELKKLEWMQFRAIRFPVDMAKSETEAATVRKRLDAGETFDALKTEYAARNPEFVIKSEIENNPNLERFRGFWLDASESKKGDIIGPIYLPEYQAMGNPDAQGRASVRNMPAAYLVLQVINHRPETAMTLQEAKPSLAPSILIAKEMQKLREENGVEIYENKLPNPAMFSDRAAGGGPSA